MCACVHACLRLAWGCETTRIFHIVSNYEISTEADSRQGSFGVYDVLKVFAVGHHDDPGRRELLADVTEHAQTARDAPADVAAVVVFQDDVESSADCHGDIERLATLRHDWFEFDTRAHDMESTDYRRLNGGVFESRCNGLRVYAVCVCNKVRLPGTGQSAHVIGGSRFTRPASNSRRTLLN